MSTTSTVCQGLPPCLDPLLLEPRVLMHQIVPSKQGLSFPWPHKQTEIPHAESSKFSPSDKMFESNRNSQESLSSWNLTQTVTNPSYDFRKSIHGEEKVYVHPLTKLANSSLSSRSLEMCTESLGSETGSGIDPNIDEYAYNHVLEKQSSSEIKQAKTREIIKKVRQSSSFPPPLTSISGSEGVQVQTHREGGRLVIKAFSFSSSSMFFRTERENGRLRLSLLKDVERENESVDQNEEEVEQENVDELEKDCDENDDDDDDDDDEADYKASFWGENIKDDGGKVGCKTNGGEWSSSRCNGGDRSGRKKIPSLQYCVAIS